MPAAVADASVLAAIAFAEGRAEEARNLVVGCDLYAPDLLAYEIASVALKKIQLDPQNSAKVLQQFGYILSSDISLVPIRSPGLVRIAREERLTVYDAADLLLSREMKCRLLTFDRQLQRRSRASV